MINIIIIIIIICLIWVENKLLKSVSSMCCGLCGWIPWPNLMKCNYLDVWFNNKFWFIWDSFISLKPIRNLYYALELMSPI